MSKVLPKIGGTFLQAESEIAAINMVLGAASCGVRAMTSSSSPVLRAYGGTEPAALAAFVINAQHVDILHSYL